VSIFKSFLVLFFKKEHACLDDAGAAGGRQGHCRRYRQHAAQPDGIGDGAWRGRATVRRSRGARVPLIVDEVYHPLYFGEPLPSTAGIENVLAMSDLSKAMSLPGLQTGWIIDPDTSRRAGLIDTRSYSTISSSPQLELLATHAAPAASLPDRAIAMVDAAICRGMEDERPEGPKRMDQARAGSGRTRPRQPDRSQHRLSENAAALARRAAGSG
jgi:hypothetical protein